MVSSYSRECLHRISPPSAVDIIRGFIWTVEYTLLYGIGITRQGVSSSRESGPDVESYGHLLLEEVTSKKCGSLPNSSAEPMK